MEAVAADAVLVGELLWNGVGVGLRGDGHVEGGVKDCHLQLGEIKAFTEEWRKGDKGGKKEEGRGEQEEQEEEETDR